MENGEKLKLNLTQKTLDVIEYMSFEPNSLPLQAIAAGTGVTPATASRILTVLKNSGYVGQHNNKEYYLTYKLFMVTGRAMGRDRFIDDMLPYLNYFTMTTDCGMTLTTFLGGCCVNLISVGRYIKFRTPLVAPGTAHPCHCTAGGKVFLSCISESELDDWLSNNCLLPYTMKTIVDTAILREELRHTREKGFGTIVAEYDENLATLAIPVQYSCGRVVSTINFTTDIAGFDKINNLEFIERAKTTLAENSKKEWYHI
jgi:IclR family pca regulon transcriptional regulator